MKKMLTKEIIKTTKKMPAERRFTLQSAVAIIIFLVGVAAYFLKDSNKVKREQYEAVLQENASLKIENRNKDQRYDSLKNLYYHDLLQAKIDFLQYQDSMKYQWREVNKTLTSK